MDEACASPRRHVGGKLMVLTIVAASLVALALISASVFVARVARVDDQQVKDLELRREDLEQLLELNRVRSQGW